MLFWIIAIALGIAISPYIFDIIEFFLVLAFKIVRFVYRYTLKPAFMVLGTVLLFIDSEKTFSQRIEAIKELWSSKVEVNTELT